MLIKQYKSFVILLTLLNFVILLASLAHSASDLSQRISILIPFLSSNIQSKFLAYFGYRSPLTSSGQYLTPKLVMIIDSHSHYA